MRLFDPQRRQRRLAESIEHAIVRAERRPSPFCAEVPVRPAAVHEAHTQLLDIAERLRMPRPVRPEGLHLARSILTDGTGPLFAPAAPGEMRNLAIRTLRALDGPLLR